MFVAGNRFNLWMSTSDIATIVALITRIDENRKLVFLRFYPKAFKLSYAQRFQQQTASHMQSEEALKPTLADVFK